MQVALYGAFGPESKTALAAKNEASIFPFPSTNSCRYFFVASNCLMVHRSYCFERSLFIALLFEAGIQNVSSWIA